MDSQQSLRKLDPQDLLKLLAALRRALQPQPQPQPQP